jgi:nitroreductase
VDLLEGIMTRRSVRRFTDAPIDDKQIEAILEAGRWAPSWSNTQCWHFIVVRDPAIKARLSETLLQLKLPDKTIDNPSLKTFKTAPVVIAACAELGRSGFNGSALATDKGDWYMFDVALAMQNMVLAAHALGLGTVHVGLLDAKKAAEILGVPPGFCVVEIMPLGHPDPSFTAKAPPRKPLAEIVFRDRWGNIR